MPQRERVRNETVRARRRERACRVDSDCSASTSVSGDEVEVSEGRGAERVKGPVKRGAFCWMERKPSVYAKMYCDT